MDGKLMRDLNLGLKEGAEEGGLDASSSPEDETPNSFYTPSHHPIPGLRGSVVASQDSMDIFLDASCSLKSPQKVTTSNLPSNGDIINTKRRRHASLEHKRTCPPSPYPPEKGNRSLEENWEEADENTCMLRNGLQKQRVRRWSGGQGSRSCTSSPFHVGHFPFSNNSLKKSLDNFVASPKKILASMTEEDTKGSPCATGYVPCAQFDDAQPTNDVSSFPSAYSPADTTAATPDARNKWMDNYVACVEANLYTNGSIAPGETKIDCSTLERRVQWKQHSGRPHQEANKGCCHYLKQEFRTSSLRMKHKSPHLFVTSQWQHQSKMSCLYLGYRLFWSLYFLMWGIWSFIGTKGYHSPLLVKGIYLIYFSNWGLWMLIVDTLAQAINVILHMKKISIDGDAKYLKMEYRHKLSWSLSNVSSTVVLLNSILFWTLSFDPNMDKIDEICVNVQVIPPMYVLFDTFISATPRQPLHAYFPMLFAGIYGTFTLVYFLLDGKNQEGTIGIYPLLDWREPGHTFAICVFILLVFIPLIHFVVCALAKLKILLWRRMKIDRNLKGGTSRSETIEHKV